MSATHTIEVTDRLTCVYVAVDDQYAAFREAGGHAGDLFGAIKAWQEQVRKSDGMLISVQGFVWMDDSDFVYLVEVDKHGRHRVLGAAQG